MRNLVALSFLITALMLLPASRAEACMECNCIIILDGDIYCFPCNIQASDGSVKLSSEERIEVSFPAKNRALITVPGYSTTQLAPGGQ